jgi:hypothetical protein
MAIAFADQEAFEAAPMFDFGVVDEPQLFGGSVWVVMFECGCYAHFSPTGIRRLLRGGYGHGCRLHDDIIWRDIDAERGVHSLPRRSRKDEQGDRSGSPHQGANSQNTSHENLHEN